MIELITAIEAALSTGTNPITAIKDATGYTLEQLAVTSGLTTTEIAAMESGIGDPERLARLTESLGLPSGTIDKAG